MYVTIRRTLSVYGAALVLFVLPRSAFCKRIDASTFKESAAVVEVTSQQRTREVTTSRPVLPDFCRNPKTAYQKSFCQTAAAGGDTASVEYETVYFLTTEIGSKIYELRGRHLEVGDYKVRFTSASRNKAPAVEFLLRDRKGKLRVVRYEISGERLKR